MFQRILVPLDGSQFSARALVYATEVAKRFGAEIILLQVVTPSPVTSVPSAVNGLISPGVIRTTMQLAEEQDKKNVERAKAYLKKKLNQIATEGIKCSYHVLVGHPAESIIEFCDKEAIDLVVMTTKGQGGIKRAILGSIADEVIRAPGFPVLAIRPRMAINT
jgi:nucleotide-binding universal stress UspA family protein